MKPNAAPSPSERVDAQRELLRHAEEASLAKALQQSDEPRAEHRVRFRNRGTEDARAQVALHRAPYWRQRRLCALLMRAIRRCEQGWKPCKEFWNKGYHVPRSYTDYLVHKNNKERATILSGGVQVRTALLDASGAGLVHAAAAGASFERTKPSRSCTACQGTPAMHTSQCHYSDASSASIDRSIGHRDGRHTVWFSVAHRTATHNAAGCRR